LAFFKGPPALASGGRLPSALAFAAAFGGGGAFGGALGGAFPAAFPGGFSELFGAFTFGMHVLQWKGIP